MAMKELKDSIWAVVEPSIKGYSNLIEILMDETTEDVLITVLARLRGEE